MAYYTEERIFFHGTSQKAWKKIKEEGFRVKKEATVSGDQPPFVFLTTTPEGAEMFARAAAIRHYSTPIVLKVTVKPGRRVVYDDPTELYGIFIENEPEQVLVTPADIETIEPVRVIF